MLLNLKIKNVALITSCDIEFQEGLNIITGETGAGKSMLIDSVNFVIGARISKDIIRTGEESCSVSCLFSISEKLNNKLLNMDIELSPDNTLHISRTLNQNGKTACKLNGQAVSVTMLKQITNDLIDIHGQHEHQSLLHPSKHLGLLDGFCAEEIKNDSLALQKLYQKHEELTKKINEISISEEERLQRIDMLTFQIEDIEQANLKIDEDKHLQEQKMFINEQDKILQNLNNSIDILYNKDDAVIDNLSKAMDYINSLADIDNTIMPLYDELNTTLSSIESITDELRKYEKNLDTKSISIDDIEERLNTIYQLKRKYGKTIEDILDYLEKIKIEFNDLQANSEICENYVKEKEMIYNDMQKISKRISKIRKENALKVEKHIIETLKDLGMSSAKFQIIFEEKEIGEKGFDKIEFFISANKGEAIKPLNKIASGGEMSRIMLSLKTLLAKNDEIDTFIFDEIDTGVSGKTAHMVAEKLAIVSKQAQILCITHLPQIASMADAHYLIEKTEDDTTKTIVTHLSDDGEINEIARLLGGAAITKSTIATAKELKTFSNNFKKGL